MKFIRSFKYLRFLNSRINFQPKNEYKGIDVHNKIMKVEENRHKLKCGLKY